MKIRVAIAKVHGWDEFDFDIDQATFDQWRSTKEKKLADLANMTGEPRFNGNAMIWEEVAK